MFVPIISAADDGLDEYLNYIQMENNTISLSTKTPRFVYNAANTVKIITQEDIRNSSASSLTDILKQVPGFDISSSFININKIGVRGINNLFSEKILILLNGHRLNSQFTGGATWVYDNIDIRDIQKIEIIRGPGSALFGSNAFVGVINIITSVDKFLHNQFKTTLSVGDFNTKRHNVKIERKYENYRLNLQLALFETDGNGIFSNENSSNDLYFSVSDNKFKFSGGYRARTFIGDVGKSVDPVNVPASSAVANLDQYYLDAAYKKDIKNSSYSIKLKYDEFKMDLDAFTSLRGFYVFVTPKLKNRELGAEMLLEHKLFNDNKILGGFDYDYVQQYDVSLTGNFNFDNASLLPTIQETKPFNQNTIRNIYAYYLQDEWDVTDFLNITAGLRHDFYSDFGNSLNPRLAVIFYQSEMMYMKLLYGRAFRAPNFVELYNTYNQFVLGNKDLKPEIIDTYEVNFGLTNKYVSFNVNYFYNEVKELIGLSNTAPQIYTNNPDKIIISGIETEVNLKYKNSKTYINYSYQQPKDQEIPDLPRHMANLGLDIDMHYLMFNTKTHFSGERSRAAGDTKSTLPSFTVTDVSLINRTIFEDIEIKATVYNLFDTDYEDPAPLQNKYAMFSSLSPSVADHNRPGKSYFLTLKLSY